MKMNWDDIDNILYDGDKTSMQGARCPDCGKNIGYKYTESTGLFEVRCDSCGYYSRASKSPMPNCVLYFGSEATIK
ncbi:MAG: hypothetical protein RR347_09130 [Anaerovoracaceae bacterium]